MLGTLNSPIGEGGWGIEVETYQVNLPYPVSSADPFWILQEGICLVVLICHKLELNSPVLITK